jgi:uncharacterized phage protein gp47/JayE
MADSATYENRIVNRLSMTDPQLSVGLGTPVRKIIEAVALEMSGYDSDVTATSTLYSINSVSGTELDYLVGQFGFARQEARSARGTVTITRDNADTSLIIPYGTVVYKPATNVSASVIFQTATYQTMDEGVNSVEVTVVASVAGTAGNVAADTVTRTTGLAGYVSINNPDAMTGGRDAETDAQLRTRFLQTVFRNESSTRDQYLGLARAHESVSRGLLVGQECRYSEIVQATRDAASNKIVLAVTTGDTTSYGMDVAEIIDTDNRYWVTRTDSNITLGSGEYQVSNGGLTVTLLNQSVVVQSRSIQLDTEYDLGYTYISNVTVKKVDGTDVTNGRVVNGVTNPTDNYSLDLTTGKFSVSSDSTTVLIPGDVLIFSFIYTPNVVGERYTIEFDYRSKHNRNTVKSVDLYVDGRTDTKVSDVQYIDFAKQLGLEYDGPDISLYERSYALNGAWAPTSGHIYVPLAHQPLMGSTINGLVNMGVSLLLKEGEQYIPIHWLGDTRQSPHGMDAIELLGTVSTDDSGTKVFKFSTTPTTSGTIPNIYDLTPINVPYYYNSAVNEIQDLIDAQSVVTSDSLVHEGVRRILGINLAIMYSTYARESVEAKVQAAVIDWANALPFGSVIQFSDVETVVANVSGVDNVRVAQYKDAGLAAQTTSEAYGIVEYKRDGKTPIYTDGSNSTLPHIADFQLAANEIPTIQYVNCYTRTQKVW